MCVVTHCMYATCITVLRGKARDSPAASTCRFTVRESSCRPKGSTFRWSENRPRLLHYKAGLSYDIGPCCTRVLNFARKRTNAIPLLVGYCDTLVGTDTVMN